MRERLLQHQLQPQVRLQQLPQRQPQSKRYAYCNRYRYGHSYPNAETYAYTTISADTEASPPSRTSSVAGMQGNALPTLASGDAANRQFQFHNGSQLFISLHNVTLSVAAMRVSNPDCAIFRING